MQIAFRVLEHSGAIFRLFFFVFFVKKIFYGNMLNDNDADNAVQADQNLRGEIARVSVRIPPFWSINPAMWFSQVEAQFAIAGISNDFTRYNTVVGAMDSSVLTHVSDILLGPEQQKSYKALKERLIQQFADSEQQRLRKLLQDLPLDGKKPTALLREMRTLAGSTVSDELLQSLWSQRLPTQAKAILSAHDGNLDQLAKLADKIVEVNNDSSVNAISGPADSALERLERRMDDLTRQIASLSTNHRSRSSTRRHHSRNRSKSQHSDCYYHRRFGKDARNCRSPCKQKKSENSKTSH